LSRGNCISNLFKYLMDTEIAQTDPTSVVGKAIDMMAEIRHVP